MECDGSISGLPYQSGSLWPILKRKSFNKITDNYYFFPVAAQKMPAYKKFKNEGSLKIAGMWPSDV